jgi:hypothetical protein
LLVHRQVQRLLLQEREQKSEWSKVRHRVQSRYEPVIRVVVTVSRQGELLEIVLALGSAGGLAHLLHGRQQQTDEHRNNGNHDQQLDQGEAVPSPDMDFSAHTRTSPTK